MPAEHNEIITEVRSVAGGVQVTLTHDEVKVLALTLWGTRSGDEALLAKLDAAEALAPSPAPPEPANPSICDAVSATWGRRCILPVGHGGRFHDIGGGYGFSDTNAVEPADSTQEATDG